MKREIKFRAWDKKRNLFIGSDYPKNWDDNCDEWYLDVDQMDMVGIERMAKDDDFVLEQFTGLRDSKGVDVYEGDVVRIRVKVETEYSEKGDILQDEVSFHSGRFYVKGFASVLNWDDMEIEVIGTIHDAEYKELAK